MYNIFLFKDCLFVFVLEKGVGIIFMWEVGIMVVVLVKYKGNLIIEIIGSEKK